MLSSFRAVLQPLHLVVAAGLADDRAKPHNNDRRGGLR